MTSRLRRQLTAAVLAVALSCAANPVFADDLRIPNDTYFPDQWYLHMIRAPEAWTRSLGFEGVTIAIIDSGVDIDHPDLKDNIWTNTREVPGNGIDDDGNGYVDDVHGWDFVNDDNNPRPDTSGNTTLGINHGTVLAGIAAARGDNGIGIAGVSWQATIMPLRVLDSNGKGDQENVARAVEYAVHNGAKIINLSFTRSAYSDELAIALRQAYDAGVLVVAAAGNAPDGGEPADLDQHPLYPICLDADSDENFIFGVAATDDHDQKADFSNDGSVCTDISAPGTHMVSTQVYRPGSKQFGNPYGGYFNGTSLAAAEVSGVAALLFALDPMLTPKQVMNAISETAVSIDGKNPGFAGKLGHGRVDAAAAVDRVLQMIGGAGVSSIATASLLPPGASSRIIVTVPGPGRETELRLFTTDGLFVRGFNAFAATFKGGISLAIANLHGNGKREIVVGAGPGGGPQVREFDINANPIGEFFAYGENFRGGVSVAAGDLDGDGTDEIITGAGPGGGPHVRMFTPKGQPIGGFFAFDRGYRGGVSVAVGDVDGDGKNEIVVANGIGSRVRVFDAKGTWRYSFSPRGAPRTTLALADIDKDGRADIILAHPVYGGTSATAYRFDGARIAAFSPDALASIDAPLVYGPYAFGAPRTRRPFVVVSIGPLAAPARFQAYEPTFGGGVSVGITE